ncbi:ankyrin-related protein [Cryptosporidium felis]|nr:ankyrin-related protein [Cryptosporidium felis]
MESQQLELETTYNSESSLNLRTLSSVRGVQPDDCYYSADEDFQLENEEVINTNLTAPSGRFSNSNLSNGFKTLANSNQAQLENSWNLRGSLENIYQENFQARGRTSNNSQIQEKSDLEGEIQDLGAGTRVTLSGLFDYEGDASDVSVPDGTDLSSLPSKKQNSLMLRASKVGNLELVRRLLASSRSNATATNDKGFSSLHWASLGGHSQIVEELINSGADPNSRNLMLCTPLHFSVNKGFDEIVVKLLGAGARPNVESALGDIPLFSAAASGYEKVVRVLLKHGADPNLKNKQGLTPKDVAETQGYSEIAKILQDSCMQKCV